MKSITSPTILLLEKSRPTCYEKLNAWRKSINDPGVTEAFRRGGWPATYPTKTLEEWQAVVGKMETVGFPGIRCKRSTPVQAP